jgi:pyruvate,orthophosphate dikinase
MEVGGKVIKEGDWLSIDGFSAEVIMGKLETRPSEVLQVLSGELPPEKSKNYQQFVKLMAWADDFKKMQVWANADTPKQAALAVKLGAQGIGLCRTEHMFFEGDRIQYVRRMILSESEEQRRDALMKLAPMQKEDFAGIFKAMEGRPVTVRLLDPPLHEFLPSREALKPDIFNRKVKEVADALSVSPEEVEERIEALHENNPMLGHRGCRLGISYPEIYEMQIRAIIEAACDVAKQGLPVKPEIMIPIVATEGEMRIIGEQARKLADEIIAAVGVDLKYMIGTMIELPRACMVADQIAGIAEFFSFGTNDLTQTTCGISRDDVKGFMGTYVAKEIYPVDPFQRLDRSGVGALMKIAVEKGRRARPSMQIGICGEHGGEPNSVEFCHQIGLDYVSCSPFRVPVARLASAQSSLR